MKYELTIVKLETGSLASNIQSMLETKKKKLVVLQ